MAERMPCREMFLLPMLLGRAAIYGPPPDGQRCYAWAVEADGMSWNHCLPEGEAIARLEELRMYESRSLMELPDG